MSGLEPGSTGEAAALLGVAEFELKLTVGGMPAVTAYIAAVDRYVERSSDEMEALRALVAELEAKLESSES